MVLPSIFAVTQQKAVEEREADRLQYNTEMIVNQYERKCLAKFYIFRKVQNYGDGLDHFPDELVKTKSVFPDYLVDPSKPYEEKKQKGWDEELKDYLLDPNEPYRELK